MAKTSQVPRFVRLGNVLTTAMVRAGFNVGLIHLLTVRGRKSGQPRTTPIAVVEQNGKRYLAAPYGIVDWVRNLRAAGRATITAGQRKEEVRAVELGPTEAAAFIRDVLAPQARQTWLGGWIVRAIDKIDFDNPVEAAEGRPVFELYPIDQKVAS